MVGEKQTCHIAKLQRIICNYCILPEDERKSSTLFLFGTSSQEGGGLRNCSLSVLLVGLFASTTACRVRLGRALSPPKVCLMTQLCGRHHIHRNKEVFSLRYAVGRVRQEVVVSSAPESCRSISIRSCFNTAGKDLSSTWNPDNRENRGCVNLHYCR